MKCTQHKGGQSEKNSRHRTGPHGGTYPYADQVLGAFDKLERQDKRKQNELRSEVERAARNRL